VGRPQHIELGAGRDRARIPILYEDRAVLAIDKPAGWLLVPFNWQRTARNLQAALTSSIAAGDYWARSRNLRFLRHIHRLDGDTSGILLLGKSPGAVDSLGRLFESRRMHKTYLAVVDGDPGQPEWVCDAPIGPDPAEVGKMRVDPRGGKPAETRFRVLAHRGTRTLIEAEPVTGRTHQIRIHLNVAGCAILGDALYGNGDRDGGGQTGDGIPTRFPLGLRAVSLSYRDPFRGSPVHVEAPTEDFLLSFGFDAPGTDPAAAPPPVSISRVRRPAASRRP
jgi:RluA family pseudouridine synthase